jgi:SAM-dependent methyltransferase
VAHAVPVPFRSTLRPNVGQRIHRAWFSAVSLLPPTATARVRSLIFDLMFTGGTPWDYDGSTFERIKREAMVTRVPEWAEVIVEIGVADGHNLVPLAARAPRAEVVGVDVSRRAVALARKRVDGHPRIRIGCADAAALASARPDLWGRTDVLVISEVLYYLGGPRALQRALAPLRGVLGPRGRVLLVHGGHDAASLHAQATQALGVTQGSTHVLAADGQPFVIAEARPSAHVRSTQVRPGSGSADSGSAGSWSADSGSAGNGSAGNVPTRGHLVD